MKNDPIEEWRRLTEHYREMSDEELYELDADFSGLTETAQQVLREEMNARKLEVSRTAETQESVTQPAARRWELTSEAPQVVEDAPEAGEEEDAGLREFTWKTVLCDCAEREEALMLQMALRRAGIDSWVDGSCCGSNGSQVAVAADQLEEAQKIAAQPIPQEIIDEFMKLGEEYTLPVCPQCGVEDPVLESADPVNSWLCESCGAQWSDAVPSEAS